MSSAEQLTLAVRTNLSVDAERREQKANLARVSSHLAETICQFARDRGLREFFIDELREYVVKRARIAPASPDRILRDLRHRGVLDYEVVNRRGALYRFIRTPL